MNINYYEDQGFNVSGTVGEVSPEEEYDDYDDNEEDHDISSLSSPPRSPSSLSSGASSFVDNSFIPEYEQNPGEWVNMPSMTLARFRFASATVNGRLYVFGGSAKSQIFNQIELYTPDTGTWINTLPPMETRRSGSSAAVVGDDIYVIGGAAENSLKTSSTVQKFNIRTNSFEAMPSMKTRRAQHVSISIGKKIYVIGGYERKACEIFDTETEEWSSIPSTIVERSICAAVAVGDKIFCIGGISVNKRVKCEYDRYLNTMEILNTITNTWSLSEATMQNRRAGCCAVTDGSTITVVGGRDENGDILAIEEYDIQRNEWRPSSSYRSLEEGRSKFASMMFGSDVVIIGGIRNNNLSRAGVLNSVQICKSSVNSPPHIRAGIWSSNNTSNIKRSTVPPSVDEESLTGQNPGEWVDMPSMTLARYRFASATVNERLYIFGGSAKNNKRMNQSELYIPDTGLWSSTIPPMETRRCGASAAVVGDDIYIIGGKEDNKRCPSCSCERFNMRTNSFEDMPPMKTGKERHISIAIGKKIYVFGGFRRNKCEIFDTETEQWSSIPSTIIGERCLCAAVAVGNEIYCIGGISDRKKEVRECDRYLNKMEIFNTTTNTWSLSEATMQYRRAGCCAVTDGSTITVVGGRDENGDVLAIEEYDIEKKEWRLSSSYCSLEKGRSEFTAMLVKRDLIIVGGRRDNDSSHAGVLDSVQICRSSPSSPISEMENDKVSKNLRRSSRNKKSGPKLKSKGGHTPANASAGKHKAARSIGRKKQKTAADTAAVSSEEFGDERFLSFQEAKELKKGRIVGFEEMLFGQVRTGSLYSRLMHIEASLGVQQTLDSLSSERLDSLENLIESKNATTEEHEMDYFGEVKDGPLRERWIKLEEVDE